MIALKGLGLSAMISTVFLLSSGSTAHQPGEEFAGWFQSLKVPGIERPRNPADASGHYWIKAEGERIQVPTDKILHHIDNPTGRAVACLRHFNGHPIVHCFVRPSES